MRVRVLLFTWWNDVAFRSVLPADQWRTRGHDVWAVLTSTRRTHIFLFGKRFHRYSLCDCFEGERGGRGCGVGWLICRFESSVLGAIRQRLVATRMAPISKTGTAVHQVVEFYLITTALEKHLGVFWMYLFTWWNAAVFRAVIPADLTNTRTRRVWAADIDTTNPLIPVLVRGSIDIWCATAVLKVWQ